MRIGPVFVAIATVVMISGVAPAQQVSLDGSFTALSACEANRKKDRDNPGDVRLEVQRAYAVIARNATPGTHYRIRVPGAPQIEERWVAMSCGTFTPAGGGAKTAVEPKADIPAATSAPDAGDRAQADAPAPPSGIEAVLAASWEPAFCASRAGADKKECRTQTADRYDATHFSLHGLWPDDLDDTAIFPCYCDRGAPTSCDVTLAQDRSVGLSADVRRKLSVAMPGVQSGLERHEWPKHGSCFGAGIASAAGPDAYFSDAMALVSALNASPVQTLFAQNIGRVLKRRQIEATFDQAFGAGASKRLLIKCSGRGARAVISDLQINLKGDFTPAPDLASLIQAAPTTEVSTDEASCAGGRIVEAGSN